MRTTPDISVNFAGIKLANPVFTASGTCGYADELEDFMDVDQLGGFITKSITLNPRKGNPAPRIVETDAGMLNAIGLANVGVERFIKDKLPLIQKLRVPVFVNLAGTAIEDYVETAKRLADIEAVSGIELNISCPNVKAGGITFGTDPAQIEKITSAIKKASGRKTVMVKLTPSVTDIAVTARAAVNAGADAISMINTFTAMAIDIETRRTRLANRTGGLSGPAIKPIAVYLVNRVYTEVTKQAKVPILGMGGIRTAADAMEFIIAGASAVAIGTASFIEPDTSISVIEGLRHYCRRHNVEQLCSLTGSLQ